MTVACRNHEIYPAHDDCGSLITYRSSVSANSDFICRLPLTVSKWLETLPPFDHVPYLYRSIEQCWLNPKFSHRGAVVKAVEILDLDCYLSEISGRRSHSILTTR